MEQHGGWHIKRAIDTPESRYLNSEGKFVPHGRFMVFNSVSLKRLKGH